MIRALAVLLSLLIVQISQAQENTVRFADAVPGKVLEFPKDYGKHPDFQTEWWYFTGNLDSPDHRKWGFQLTFFRRSLLQKPRHTRSTWAVRDLYPAHFALANAQDGRFFHAELLSREGPGLAAAATDDLRVHVRDWSAERQGDEILLKAKQNGYAIDLQLNPLKPLVLHGASGYSRKGDTEGQASYYYSFTRLQARGTVTFDGVEHSVQGLAWMDREFGSSILLEQQAGWDWFSLQLDDGTELMVFHLRRKDGTFERPFGTFVSKDGAASDLAGQKIVISPMTTWKSPHTGAEYPSSWRIEVPSQKMSLGIKPLLADQELASSGGTRIIYWEGAVAVEGSHNGKEVRGRGYVELTGYAHSMGGKL